jgi:hypothetical protein
MNPAASVVRRNTSARTPTTLGENRARRGFVPADIVVELENAGTSLDAL